MNVPREKWEVPTSDFRLPTFLGDRHVTESAGPERGPGGPEPPQRAASTPTNTPSRFTLTGEPIEQPPPNGRASVSAPPGRFSTSHVARMLDPPVSAQAVRNWVHEDPSIVAWRDPETGYPYFDPDALQAWRAKHRPAGVGRGGKREGAGNRHQKWRRSEVVSAVGSVFEQEQGSGGAGEPGSVTQEQLRRAIEDPTSGVLGFAVGRAVHEQAKAAMVLEGLRLKRGEVLDVEEARAAWARALTVLARALEDVPERVAPELVRVVMGEGGVGGVGGVGGEGTETPAEVAQRLTRVFAGLVRGAIDAARVRVADDPVGMVVEGMKGAAA